MAVIKSAAMYQMLRSWAASVHPRKTPFSGATDIVVHLPIFILILRPW